MMTSDAQTWHYGIVAQWWAEFNEDGPEIDRFREIIEQSGHPALDAACGTGRLLLPFLHAGLEVDGCDISGDMLALCRDKAAQEGFAPHLYQQALHELEIPRPYKTIIACGSIGIGGDRCFDLEAFRRFYDHLEPGGVFAFNHYLPYTADFDANWHYWTPEKRAELPEAWDFTEIPADHRRITSDGSELGLGTRVVALDPLEQVLTLEMHAERWRDGKLIEVEEYTLKEMLYFKSELVMMLEQAGFRDITVEGGYTGKLATAEDSVLLFLARK